MEATSETISGPQIHRLGDHIVADGRVDGVMCLERAARIREQSGRYIKKFIFEMLCNFVLAMTAKERLMLFAQERTLRS